MHICDFCEKSNNCPINLSRKPYFYDKPETYKNLIETERNLDKCLNNILYAEVSYPWGIEIAIYSCNEIQSIYQNRQK